MAAAVSVAIILILTMNPQLTVRTVDTSGEFQSGFYVVLHQGNKVIGTGFSGYISDSFTLHGGEEYEIQVFDYGSCRFDHWQDTGSTNSTRPVSITTSTQLTAVYACGAGGSPQSNLTVTTQDVGGRPITGLILGISPDGSGVRSGSSPATFELVDGTAYKLEAYDSVSQQYGSCRFDHWQDTGSTNSTRALSIANGTRLTAIYSCSGASSVTIRSADQAGRPVSGFHAVLAYPNGSLVAAGYTPKTFPTIDGQSYVITVDGFGTCSFSDWSDGNSGNPRQFTAANSSLVLTAVYDCGATG